MRTLQITVAGLILLVFPIAVPAQHVNEIKMNAKKYQFDPSVVKIKQGDHVRLSITALDHDHGFKLEAYDVEQLIPKGETKTVEFTADKAGKFPFECSHFCGLGHKRMKGELIVE